MMWKSIPGFPSYELSDSGAVRRSFDGRPIKVGRFDSGYSRVTLYRVGVRKTLRLARLILLTFRGPGPPQHQAAHLNGIKTDDRLDNLAWKTCQANHDDKQRHGTTARGTRHGRAKLDDAKVTAIRDSADSVSALARRFRVSRPIIQSVREHRTWRHV